MRMDAAKLFVIITKDEEISVTAMDFADAMETWAGNLEDLLMVEEHDNWQGETLH
tara:strand:+ start:1631 stop:1795 length:165 start_codon:yes stop_codon:yes gene_type:complete